MIVISDLFDMFIRDPEIEVNEVNYLINKVVNSITKSIRRCASYCVITI
jgi:hypothetical protein